MLSKVVLKAQLENKDESKKQIFIVLVYEILSFGYSRCNIISDLNGR